MKKLLVSFVVLCCISCESDSDGFFGNPNISSGSNELGIPDLESGEAAEVERYTDFGENNFINVVDQPLSTFSIDADGASFANTRRFLNLGQNPPREAVRIEEYLNYFTFDYAEPQGNGTLAVNAEIASCPWAEGHHLLRLGLKGKSIAAAELPDANYVLLIDVSGSMSSPDKLELLKTGFKRMVDQMRDTDRIAIVTYAGSAGLVLDATFGDEKNKIKAVIDQLGAGGTTAGAEGIRTAYEIAEQNLIPNGNNRIVLGSDGNFNVGPSSTKELVTLIEEQRDKGIFLTVLGVGQGNLNEAAMEQIANNGNGNYEYIDGIVQMEKVFVTERNKFFAVAKDTKIQLEFDPAVISSYRLIGYENRTLTEEEFEDSSTDAGEIGAGQTITAIYELIPVENATAGNVAGFEVRYKTVLPTEIDQELSLDIPFTSNPIATASQNMRFAASTAAFGLLLKESEFKGSASKEMILELGQNAIDFDPNGYKLQYLELVSQVQN